MSADDTGRQHAQRNSVQNLQGLYTLVIGIALSYAMLEVVDVDKAKGPVDFTALPLFLGLLVTLIPFYHGALRHLDATYIERGGKDVRSGALLLDFAILFIEGCIFIAMSQFLGKPIVFAWTFVVLLAVDIAWAFGAHLAFSQSNVTKAEITWAMINLIAGAILAVTILALGRLTSSTADSEYLVSWIVPIVAFIRTVCDYKFSWDFYYPPA